MADGNLPDLSDLGVPATLGNTKPRLSPRSSAKIAASKADLSDLAAPPAAARPQQPSPLDRFVRGFKGETPNAAQPPTAVASQPPPQVTPSPPRVTTPPVTPQKPAVSPVPNVTTPVPPQPAAAAPPTQPPPQPPTPTPAPPPAAAAPAKPPVPGNLSLADVQNPKPAPGAPLPPAGGLGTGADRPGIDPRLQPIIDAATKLSQQRGTAPVLDGLTKGIQSGVEQANRDLGYPGAIQAPEKPPPESEPISPADILDLNKLLPKVGYMLGHGYPQLSGGAVGAAAGGAVGGPPGAVVGAGAGFAAATFAQTLRPAMEAAIKQGMSPDDAFTSALTEAGKSAAWSGVAGLAFGFAPFGGLVKDILFQSLGIQPGIAVAETISNNIAAGKDPLEGTDQAALSAMFGTLVPAAVMHAVLRPPAPPKAEAATAEAGAPPPGPGFDQAQREASANRPPPAGGQSAEVEGWVTAAQQATAGVGPDNLSKLRDFYGHMLKAKGWSDADANDLLARVFTEATAPTQGAPPTALPPPGGAEAAPAAGARPETPQAAPADADTAALKAAGFGDDEIARMDPQARQVALETLRGMPGAQAAATPPEAPSSAPNAAAQPSVIVTPPPRAPANATPEQATKSAVDFINADPNLTPEDKAAFNAVIPGVIYGTDQTKPAEAAPDTTGQHGQDVAAGRNGSAVEEPQGSRDTIPAGGGAVAKTEVAPQAPGTRYGGADNRAGAPAAEPARVQADLAKPEVAAALNRPVTVDRSYDIPYLAGYSEDGNTIFIDRHLPQKLTIAGKEIDPTQFLQRHEMVEKALIDALNHSYLGAHEIATGAEHAALVAAGIDPAAYEAALKPYIKTAEHKTLTRVPANLDLTPYDDTNATAIKARMAQAEVAPKASEAAVSAALARAPKREKTGKPASLVRFLASHGGIRDFKGELGKGLSIGKHFVPGYGKLVRPNGMTLDHAREIAAEAGYLGGNQGQAMAETTVDDLLQALDEEINRGRPVISAHDEQGKAEHEAAQATKAHADAKREIVAALKASGGKTTDTGFIDHAADLLARGKAGDVESALERAALELADQDATPQEREAYDAIVPGWETAADEGAARAAGERSVEPPQAGQDTGPPAKAVGGREPVSGRAAGEKSELASKVERGADNKDQFVLPGAERISDAELAKRKAAQGLKPKVAQKPADEGLFSDEGQQTDLVDLAKRGNTVARTPKQRAALERALSAIVKRVAGKDVEVSFEPTISAVEAGDAAYNAAMGKYQEAGGKLSKTAGGSARMRLDGTALIRIAMNDQGFNPTDSAYHEAYHRVEAQLMTDAEYAAVNSEAAVAEARRMAAEVVGRDPNGPEMRDLPGYEARAIAFEGYVKGWEAKGILPALGRFFARLARLLREVRALLTRMNVRSLRDVFGDVYAGKMAEREPGFRDVTAGSTVEREKRPVFYSAALKAVEASKTAKASPEQWLATVKNTPGVKQEEIDWIGLEDWLKGQTGSVTKEAVADFVRANQIEVKETDLTAAAVTGTTIAELQSHLPEAFATLSRAGWEPVLSYDGAEIAFQDAEGTPWWAGQVEEMYRDGYPPPGRKELIPPQVAEAVARIARNFRRSAQSGAKFEQYSLPGGKDYHELLLSLPERQVFDPKRVGIERRRQSVTQGALAVTYNGRNIGHFDLFDGGRERTDAEAVAIARQYWEEGNRYAGVKAMDRNNFRSSHFSEPNIVSHVRFNTRTDAAGKRTLFLEEIQSDWHQQGRERGYAEGETPAQPRMLNPADVAIAEAEHQWIGAVEGRRAVSVGKGTVKGEAEAREYIARVMNRDAREQWNAAMTARARAVPDAPFKTTWPELALKRMVRWAAENGYDQVAWTPGIEQVKRYEAPLRQQVKSIEWSADPKGAFHRIVGVTAARDASTQRFYLDERGVVNDRTRAGWAAGWDRIESDAAGKPIEDLVGKEIARRIMEENEGKIEGDNLVIGGKGMEDFYDKILVNAANKLGKKFGAKVGPTEINAHDVPRAVSNPVAVHALPITPEMRDSVMGGQTLFSRVPHNLRDVSSAVDSSGVDQMPRTELGSRVSREQRRAVKGFVHDQEDALFRISTNSQADVADMRERLGDLPKAYTGDADEKFYRHVEDQKGVPLTPKERALYNETVAPLKRMEQQAYVEARTLGRGQTLTAAELEELGNALDPEYMHRMVQGKTPQFDTLQGREASGNPIFSGRSLSKSTSSLKSPTYYAIEGENGARRVVSKGSEGINVWGKNKPTPLKGTNAKTSLKMGDRFKIGGQMWTVTRARTPEIEAATPTRYYQSAFANTVDNILRLRRVVRALKYVDELKHTPEWGEISVPMDEHHPADWKMVDAPGLRGFWLDPRIANPINDFLEGGARIWKGDLAEKIEKVNRLAVGSLFWSPIPHAMNVGAHWFVARGWDWLTPTGWYSTIVDGMKALKSTVTQDARYRDYLRSGASLIGSRVTNRNFVEAMLTKVGWQIERERNKFQKIADILGYQHVEDLIRSYYKGVSTILWMSNDVFMLQRIMELERKGYNREDAIKEAGGHIPDYRLPSTVMGSRAFSEVMQDPNLFMFSRYHYGIFRAYAETIRGLMGKGVRSPSKNVMDGIGRLLALGVLAFMIYPVLDDLAKLVTGDKKAKAIRRGPATFPQNLIDWKAGNKNWLQVMLSFMSPSPVLLEAEQQAFNADLYLSQYGPGVGVIQKKNDDLWKAVLHRLQHAGGTIPVGGQVQTALNPKKGVDNVLLQQIGISVP